MKIPKLKPNSPDFDDIEVKINAAQPEQCCDHEGCVNEGLYRAPQAPDKLNEYFYFCLEHIQDYNKQWNYFENFSDDELEHYLRYAHLWERPTWNSGIHPLMEEKLRARIFDFYDEEDLKKTKFRHFEKDGDDNIGQENFESEKNTPELEALDILGITPPTDLPQIKKRYKSLVKRYHPDTNRDDDQAEEKIKKINAAYTLLKIAYAKYDEMNIKA